MSPTYAWLVECAAGIVTQRFDLGTRLPPSHWTAAVHGGLCSTFGDGS
jgi:hypothetical protein